MSQLNRLLALAGLSPKSVLIKELQASKKSLIEAHDLAIRQAENDIQLDEGLFTSLKAALGTVKDIGAATGPAIKAAVKKLAEPIKQMYLDNKAKEELKDLYKSFQKIVLEFERMTDKAPTIMERDPEVQKEIQLFKDLMVRTLRSLRARAAVAMAEGKAFDEDDVDRLFEAFMAESPASPANEKQSAVIGAKDKADPKKKEPPKKGQKAILDDDDEGEIESTDEKFTTVKLKSGQRKKVETSSIKCTLDGDK